MEKGEFIYSCNCGWLDAHHAIPETTNTILDLLRIDVNPPSGMNQDKRVIQLQIHIPMGISLDNRFVVKINPISQNQSLALGILMAHENKRESLQGWPIARQLGHSYFSEEDLTSDLIGYYMAINKKPGLRDNAGFDWLVPICKMPPNKQKAIEWSLKVFDQYGDSVEKWEEWANPRLLCSSEIDSFCGDASREWPSQFSIDSAAQSGVDWWKYSWSDGFLKQSDINDNVFYLWP